MLMTDYHFEIEEPTVPEARAMVLGAHVCVRCKRVAVTAPIPSRIGYLCASCFIRPHLLPFIVERLARKEAQRATA